MLFGPRYQRLLDEIFDGSRLPDDFSLYLHAPTVTDPSLAPAGLRHLLRALARAAPRPRAARLGRDRAGLRRADPRRARDAAARTCASTSWSGAGFTPRDFQRRAQRATMGSAFCCAPPLTQSAWFRPHNRDPRIPGLYLVGAGTHPGAGVPGVVNSAKATARLIVAGLRLMTATGPCDRC